MPRQPRAPRPRKYDPVLPSDLASNPTLADKQRVGTTDPSIARKRVAPKIPESYSPRRAGPSGISPPSTGKSVGRSQVSPPLPEMPQGRRSSAIDLSSSSRNSGGGKSGGAPSEIAASPLMQDFKRRSPIDPPPPPESIAGRRAGSQSMSLSPISPPEVPSGAGEASEPRGFEFQGITGVQTASSFSYGGPG